MTSQDLLAAALRYASFGWPVFPCKPGEKIPLKGSRGFKDATTDPAQIERWWRAIPNANIGLATGLPGPDVVDFDTKNGAPGKESCRALSDAGLLDGMLATVTTPSGGRHFYYLGTTDQRNSANGKHGVDFRSNGGYVLAPPSFVVEFGAAYEVARTFPRSEGRVVSWQAIKDFLDPQAPEEPEVDYSQTEYADCIPDLGPEASGSYGGENDRAYYGKAVDGLCAEMARTPEGQRNHTLNKLAFRLGQVTAQRGMGRYSDLAKAALAKAARKSGLTDAEEIRKTIRSGFTKGVTSGRPV